MSSPLDQVKSLRGKTGAAAVVGLGAAAVWITMLAIVGAIAVSGDGGGGGDSEEVSATGALPGQSSSDGSGGDASSDTTVPVGATVPGQTSAPKPGEPALPGQPATTATPGAAPTGQAAPSPTGGDTTGVTDAEIKIGVHAPITFSGVPLNLAEDPISGVRTYTDYINAHGGINGRKIVLDIQDDRYDSEGARNSAQILINDHKNFMVSGTLGIDQVGIVATEAAKRGVPYTAAGGVESAPAAACTS